MKYAPIIIPTLNRKQHLMRCLNSLAANTGAEHTEVFISVDFPPAERYRQGYQEVKEYLDKGDFSAFKAVHVIYQQENLGAKDNCTYLIQMIGKTFDRYIFTEDDNEFSPNFLEYINKGLALFEADSRVMGICAAKDAPWAQDGGNVLFSKLFPAYGYGTWVEKEQALVEDCHRLLLPKRVYGPKTMLRLMRQNLCLFTSYVCPILCGDEGFFWNKDGSLYLCDTTRSLYMHLTDKVCVVPTVAKSRTWGNDGSGVNMPATDVNPEADCPIDTNPTFAYTDISKLRFLEENYKIGDDYMSAPYRKRWFVPVVYYLLLLLCFGSRKRAIAFVKKLRSTLKKS